MGGIIVYCLITYNNATFGINILTEGFIARSTGACMQESHRKGGLTGYQREYDLSNPKELREFTIKCGPNGVDCPYIKAEKEK